MQFLRVGQTLSSVFRTVCNRNRICTDKKDMLLWELTLVLEKIESIRNFSNGNNELVFLL
jgi:hypothetical protein